MLSCIYETVLWAMALAGAILPNAVGETGPDASANFTNSAIHVTETCLDEDKPDCLTITRYLPSPDGSNDYKIVLAKVGGSGPEQLVSIEKLPRIAFIPSADWTNPPVIAITEPIEAVTTHPMIIVRGTCDRPVKSLHVDILSAGQEPRQEPGYVNEEYFDTTLWKATTNYWSCVDLKLADGTNTLILRCEDFNGRVTTTNISYVLRLDKNNPPPKISMDWPSATVRVGADFFTARGHIDDMSTIVVGQISGGGQTLSIKGLVERDGRFWIEHLPLLAKSNLLTITATDPVGNSSTTNLEIVRSDTTLVINPIPPKQLWQLQITVTGKVIPPDRMVWVNARRAIVRSDGAWMAAGISPTSGGCAIFRATAVGSSPPPLQQISEIPRSVAGVIPWKSVSLTRSTSAGSDIILNIDQPTYGAIDLHLTGTSGKNFILVASTNLVDWTPILTNLESAGTIDYADTNATTYGCRFFRTIPIP